MIKNGSSYISFFQTMKETSKVVALQKKNVTGYSMHLIPRSTLAQKIQTKCDRPKKFTEEEVKKILI